MCKDLAMQRVVVLALDGVYPFELGIPARIFGTAVAADGSPLYEIRTCSLDGAPIRTNADFTIAVEWDSSALDDADIVVIPPFNECDDHATYCLPEHVADALRRPQTRVVSFCSSAFVLATLGLLDGRPATTHWNQAERFRREFPRVRMDADVLFVDDGRILTAAGSAAGIDLCLHLLRGDHGSAVANRVARLCIVPPWREGGQAQFIDRPMPEAGTAGTAGTRAWALDHLDRPLSLAELAAHARMSVRTFCRRFREETGLPPGQWLTRQRVDLARHLLEVTDLPIDRVATESGLGTAASLRQHLATTIGVSPSTYRHTFRTARL
ncbi:GlxA family transcriptional regulator [Nocardia caishijiensis]|uniref:Transcriptional regulator GlxA family with amidase domain n=1 Tax=Nocardia caishijiensis TaxID=184756 RepID=A0ABQ6YEK6_9NOCA|nr:helix-turn-helix domain-containing protein [Nocardia caishijiensis]KAF0835831.1 transcriptional regulator GlxA family with amidase domain [Nocardia caishijiensis]